MMSSPEETKPAAEAASQNGVTAKSKYCQTSNISHATPPKVFYVSRLCLAVVFAQSIEARH